MANFNPIFKSLQIQLLNSNLIYWLVFLAMYNVISKLKICQTNFITVASIFIQSVSKRTKRRVELCGSNFIVSNYAEPLKLSNQMSIKQGLKCLGT
jgi:hypothetical protein